VDRNDLIDEAGRMLRHVVGVLLLAWRRVIRAFLIAMVAGLLVGEMGGILQTHRFPPPVLAQVVVLIFATVVAYGVALTVVIDEIIVGIIDTLRLILGEAEAGTRAFEALAAREGASLREDINHLVPLRGNKEAAASEPEQQVTAEQESSSQQTEVDTAATDEFSNTAPRLAVKPSPVRADQLPRIEWTYHAADEDTIPAGKCAECLIVGRFRTYHTSNDSDSFTTHCQLTRSAPATCLCTSHAVAASPRVHQISDT